MSNEYILVDGREQYVRRCMSDEQYQETDRRTRIINDDALWWEPVNAQNVRYPQNDDWHNEQYQ